MFAKVNLILVFAIPPVMLIVYLLMGIAIACMALMIADIDINAGLAITLGTFI